uniref:Ovule protein n=1 Tax=Parascaris univalens TaxID=6257 RepID=A0A915C082_PARUN
SLRNGHNFCRKFLLYIIFSKFKYASTYFLQSYLCPQLEPHDNACLVHNFIHSFETVAALDLDLLLQNVSLCFLKELD